MKKNILYLLLLLTTLSCNNNLEEPEIEPITRSGNSGYTLFQNISQSRTNQGDHHITGEIYCPAAADYEFIFAYNGDSRVEYYAHSLSLLNILPWNGDGSTFRTFTLRLKKGINVFHVGVEFTHNDQPGEAKLVIRKINGSNLGTEMGYVDLTAQGVGKNLYEDPGTTEHHWSCSYCGFSLNSIYSNYCNSCGRPKGN